jgi:hypothetical protein
MNFEVDRTDLRRCRMIDEPSAPLEPGQARLSVDRFALTSNNITYAVAGDMLNYWAFFPTDAPWGRIPVWGFADVIESRHDDLGVGTRVYGYLPMSTELVVAPGKVDHTGFTDMSPHRSSMASTYNRYAAHPSAPAGGAHAENQRMVLSPLFFTSFLIDDSIADDSIADDSIATGGIATGHRVVLSSASSKTALGTAFCLRRRGGIEVVGLTSTSNRNVVEGLGVYDRVVTYDDDFVFAAAPTVFVDIAGSASVRHAVHSALGDHLVSSMIVGVTHWDAPPADGELPGPPPRMFFAPDRIAARSREWGRDELEARLEVAWHEYAAWTDGWLTYEHHAGPTALEQVYRALLGNAVDPTVGFVHTLQTS